jgi:hypothetical protein
MGGFFSGNPADTVVGTTDPTESEISEDAVTNQDDIGGFYQGSPVKTTIEALEQDAQEARDAAQAAQADAEASESAAALSASSASSSASSASSSAAAAASSASSAASSAAAAEDAASSISAANYLTESTADTLYEPLIATANRMTFYRQSTQPSGGTYREGDMWYKTDDEDLYFYREVSTNVFNWVLLSTATDNSDTLDGGNY